MDLVNFIISKIKLDIKVFISFILFFLLSNKAYCFECFKAFNLISNDLLLITDEGLFKYNIESEKLTLIISNIIEKSDFNVEHLSFAQFPEEQGGLIICRIEQYVYFFSENFDSYKSINISSLSDQKVEILLYESNNDKKSFIFYYINDSMDTILLLYEYDILTKELTLLYNYGNKLKTLEGDTVFLSSHLISCSLITEDSKDIIICLTITTQYELDLFSFDIKNNFTFYSFESIETISDLLDISSIAKNSKDDVLFCFLEVQYFKCFVYNSEKKEKSVIIEYFDGCYVYQNTRGIKYITERREYIIYCHKINPKDIMFAKLDENFNKKELEGNLEYIDFSIEDCYNVFSSSFI